MKEINQEPTRNAEMPRLHHKSSPQNALIKTPPPAKPREKRQIWQDFLHACSWSQLQRRAQPAHLWDLSKQHYGKLAACAFAGILVSKVEFGSSPQTQQSQPVAIEAGFIQMEQPSQPNTAQLVSAEIEPNTLIINKLDEIPEASKKQFFKRFGKVAQSEQSKFGIPASISLAMSILYSGFGSDELSAQHHNFFRMSCEESPTASQADYPNGCVAVFPSAWASFRAHSEFLRDNFGDLVETAGRDPQLWALGLERLGYQKQGFSAELLLAIIDKYQLSKYDK